MANIIDLKVKIGSSPSLMSSLPCAIDSATPIISWELPDGINQKRFNVRIKSIGTDGEVRAGSTQSSATFYQYPSAYQMSKKFYGLCSLQVAISEKTSGEYEYSSEELYFVFDDSIEMLSIDDTYIFRWDNAYDNETEWDKMKYNLVVSSSILFDEDSIIFDDLILSTSKTETSCPVKIENSEDYNFIYWKVRSFDGLDYSDFSRVNAFRVTNNSSPLVDIKSVEVLDNKEKDVRINFEIIDNAKDRISLEVYYCGGTTSSKYKLASLLNSVVSTVPGSYSIIWRSSLDEKKISSQDYRIKITAIDDSGLYGYDISDEFEMDNSAAGLENGGDTTLNNIYTVVGKMVVGKRLSIDNIDTCLLGKAKEFDEDYKIEPTSFSCGIGSFKKYRTGNLNYKISSPDPDKNNGGGSPDDWVMGDINGSGGSGDEEIEPWYPVGMAIFQKRPKIKKDEGLDGGGSGGSSGGGDSGGGGSGGGDSSGGEDLDSDEPNFIRSLNVDENGNYWKMDERISYRSAGNDIRWGYARFLVSFYASADAKCPTCGGKGWHGVEVDNTVPSSNKYKYKRKTCTTCMGNRFTEPNISPEEVKLTAVFDKVKKDEPIILTGGKNLLEKDFVVKVKNVELQKNNYAVDFENKTITFYENFSDVDVFYKMEKFKVENSLFSVSKWIPLEKYFSPLSKTDLLHACKIGSSKIIDPLTDFVFAPTLPGSWFSSHVQSNSKSGYLFNRKDIPEKTIYQIDCPTIKNSPYKMSGVFNGLSFIGKNGTRKEGSSEVLNYRLEGNAHVDKEKITNHISALTGKTTSSVKEYVPGTTYENEIFNRGRKTPTHRWEPGLIVMEGNLFREQNLGPLKIIFLQNNWQVYNTIHWSGPSSASSMTQVQYCRINSDGSNGVFYDVISENSEYHKEQGAWFVPPQLWHCYWKTEDQIKGDDSGKYRIRIRQYNILSKTFSQWSYSETTFQIKNSATNPANIYFVEYKKFSKSLYVYYKLDDKDGDDFDIVSISYKVGDDNWVQIDKSYIDGDMHNLSSVPGDTGNGNKHLFIWDTSPYNLRASDDYRIKIEVVKTKLVSGYSRPLLKWIKTPNTTSDKQERLIDSYRGSWIRTYWDEREQVAKALSKPYFQPGRIQELEEKIFNIKCQNEPLPSKCDGYFTFAVDGGVVVHRENGKIVSVDIMNHAVVGSVEIDGKTYHLKDWLNHEIDGISRNSLIYNYTKEIESCVDSINNSTKIINEARDYTRRCLIDQGYYCNGFKNNTPVYVNEGSNSDSESMTIDDKCYFKFKVLTYFDDSVNDKGFYEPKYSEHLGDILFTETVTDVTEDGKSVSTTFSFHEYERTSDVFSRILMDRYSTYNSQNGEPLRDMIIVNGDRIATSVGGDNYIGATESWYNPIHGEASKLNKVDSVNVSEYEVFTIPENLLPGEVRGDITDSDSFEGDYVWKVSNYNLLYGRPEEKPKFSANHSFSRDIITLNVNTVAPKGLTDAKITGIYFIDKMFDKFLIEKDGLNSNLEYFNDDNYLMGNDIVKETIFVTDPSDYDISKGYCSGFSWTPLSKARRRPVVLTDWSNENLFWYTKENTYGQSVICMAKGKTFDRVGEYCMTVPSSNTMIGDEISGADNVFGQTVVMASGIYFMYYIAHIDGEYHIKLATSTDALNWIHGDVSLPIAGVYSIFALNDNGKISLYCCSCEGGVFNVYKTSSLNGLDFSGKEKIFSSVAPISSVFVMKYLDMDVLFYTEESQVEDGYVYNIKNNSDGIFPNVNNASNPCVVKCGFGYRMFFDRGGKICSVFMKNYIEKNIVNKDEYLSNVVSGNINIVKSSNTGFVTTLMINRAYRYGGEYYCNDDLRQMDLSQIVGWIITGENNAKYKEYRVEGQFLTYDNFSDVGGDMEPIPFRYMYIAKDLY